MAKRDVADPALPVYRQKNNEGKPVSKARTLIGALFAAALVSVVVAAPARAQNVIVFAAASLKDALDEIDALAQKRGFAKVVVSYAASSALAKQHLLADGRQVHPFRVEDMADAQPA